MDRIYKTTKGIIMAEEVECADTTVKLLTALDKEEYVLVKWKEELEIYKLSLVGHVMSLL